ncbi:hypothetical protein Tco_1281907 [Tanacetum coccineum]
MEENEDKKSVMILGLTSSLPLGMIPTRNFDKWDISLVPHDSVLMLRMVKTNDRKTSPMRSRILKRSMKQRTKLALIPKRLTQVHERETFPLLYESYAPTDPSRYRMKSVLNLSLVPQAIIILSERGRDKRGSLLFRIRDGLYRVFRTISWLEFLQILLNGVILTDRKKCAICQGLYNNPDSIRAYFEVRGNLGNKSMDNFIPLPNRNL